MDRNRIRAAFLRMGETITRAAEILADNRLRLKQEEADLRKQHDRWYIEQVALGQRDIARMHLDRAVIGARSELGLPTHPFIGLLVNTNECQYITKSWSSKRGVFVAEHCGLAEALHPLPRSQRYR